MQIIKLSTCFWLMFFLCSKVSESQTSYSINLGTVSDETCSEAIELDDGSFMFSIMAREDFFSPFKSNLVKISPSGSVIYGPVIENPDGRCLALDIVRTGDNSFVYIGEWEWTWQHSRLWYLGIDSCLNISWDKKYVLCYNWLMFVRSLVNSNGDVVSALTVTMLDDPSYNKLLLIKTTVDGDSLLSKYDDPEGSTRVQDIIEFDSGYVIFTPGYSYMSQIQAVKIDYDFNLQSIDSVRNRVNNVVTAKINNDTSYYLSGNVTFGYPSRDISIGLYSEDNDAIFFQVVGKSADTIDFGGADQSMDFIDNNSIFLGGTSHIGPSYYEALDNWYILCNFDSSLNLRWTKFYGGEAYHFLRSVVATKDGGAFLIGTRYDDMHPENKLDLFIVKTDSLGLVTGFDEKGENLGCDAIVYPNPGTDYLMIESGPQISGAVFRMFDIQGKELLQTELTQTSCRVSTAHLPSGTYIWNIVANDKVIESGKWMLVR